MFPSDLLEVFMILWLLSGDVLDAGSVPRVHHVVPVLGRGPGQVPPPLDDQDAGVAELPMSRLRQLEAVAERLLVLAAACES